MIEGDRLPTLDGRRVRLRWLVQADVAALYEVFSNADVMRYWSCPPYANEGQAHALLAEIHRLFAARSLFEWGVARRDDDRVIGTCTLSHIDARNLRAEVGYALGRAHCGQGLMSDALSLLLEFAFETLGLRRLEADVDPHNTASIRLLERFGFQREGLMRERWFVSGEVQDALIYGLLRRECAARKPAR
jgi:RimJ/RimL family protein N-acetyltransferase